MHSAIDKGIGKIIKHINNKINICELFKLKFTLNGSAYNAASYYDLKEKNIKMILNVTSEISEYYPDDFEYHNIYCLEIHVISNLTLTFVYGAFVKVTTSSVPAKSC